MVSLHGGERETARWDQVAAVCSEEEGLFLFRRDNKLHVFPAKAISRPGGAGGCGGICPEPYAEIGEKGAGPRAFFSVTFFSVRRLLR